MLKETDSKVTILVAEEEKSFVEREVEIDNDKNGDDQQKDD